jgi:hypothetical protein
VALPLYLIQDVSSYSSQITSLQTEPGRPAAAGPPIVAAVPAIAATVFTVVSKRHRVVAGLWDDIIPTVMPASWKVQTFLQGKLKLPSACCAGRDGSPLVSGGCSFRCRPLQFERAYDQWTLAFNDGPASSSQMANNKCGGLRQGDRLGAAARKQMKKFFSAASGDLPRPAIHADAPVINNQVLAEIQAMCQYPGNPKMTHADINIIYDYARWLLRFTYPAGRSLVAVAQWNLAGTPIRNLPVVAATFKWSAASCDHSKLGWGNTNIICAGDLNRHGGKDSMMSGNMWR